MSAAPRSLLEDAPRCQECGGERGWFGPCPTCGADAPRGSGSLCDHVYPLYGEGDERDTKVATIDTSLRLRGLDGRFIEADVDYRRQLLAACQIVEASRAA